MGFDPDATMQAPPPRRLAGADLLLALLVASLLLASLPLVTDDWPGYYAMRFWLPLVWLAGIAGGGPLLAHRGPWFERSEGLTRHRFLKPGTEASAGAYGAVAVVCFLWLEGARVYQLLESLYEAGSGWPGVLVLDLLDFGLDSLLNAVYSVAWPGFWKDIFTAGAMVPAVAIGVVIFEGGRRGVALLPRRAAA
jgi:hypothetical protein